MRTFVLITFWGLFLGGCALGPDFKTPEPPEVDSYTESKLSGETVQTKGTGGQAQRFLLGHDIPACWWHLFHSKPLNVLIQKALKCIS